MSTGRRARVEPPGRRRRAAQGHGRGRPRPPLARASRVPAHTRQTGGRGRLPARPAAGRGSGAVHRPGDRGPRAGGDVSDAGLRGLAPHGRNWRQQGHRAVDRARRPGRSPGSGPLPRHRRDPRGRLPPGRGAEWQPAAPPSRSVTRDPRTPEPAERAAEKLRSGRRAARYRFAAPRRPAQGRQGGLRAPANPPGPVHSLGRARGLAPGAA